MDREHTTNEMNKTDQTHQTNHPQCPVCTTATNEPLVTLATAPVHCNLLWHTRSNALNAPCARIELRICTHCGHIWNCSFEPAHMSYTQQYDNSLHFSPRFQSYAQSLVHHLITTYGLHQKTIIDVGCGQGEFLRMLCKQGNNYGIGYDPTYVPDPSHQLLYPQVRFVQEQYTARTPTTAIPAHQTVDCICARHVLEHIHTPQTMLHTMRQHAHNDTLIFLEVPNALFMVDTLAIWDILYEHCGYYSAASLLYLLQMHGYHSLAIDTWYDEQFITVVARVAAEHVALTNTIPITLHRDAITQAVVAFATRYEQKRTSWHIHLKTMAEQGKKAVVWGAGSKGVMFLAQLIPHSIEYIVDINPRKQGMFTPVGGQQIVPPDFLQTYQPDMVIVMNPIYLDEIRHMLSDMSIQAECIVA